MLVFPPKHPSVSNSRVCNNIQYSYRNNKGHYTVCYSDSNMTYDDRNICVQHLSLVTTTCRGDYNSRPLAKIYRKLEMAG